MGIVALLAQLATLRDSEPVLLVHDCKGQCLEGDTLLHKGLCPNGNVDSSCAYRFPHDVSLPNGETAEEKAQSYSLPAGSDERPDRVIPE
jgi:hypothetical protein